MNFALPHLSTKSQSIGTVTVLMTGQAEGQSGSEPVAWVNTAGQRRVFTLL